VSASVGVVVPGNVANNDNVEPSDNKSAANNVVSMAEAATKKDAAAAADAADADAADADADDDDVQQRAKHDDDDIIAQAVVNVLLEEVGQKKIDVAHKYAAAARQEIIDADAPALKVLLLRCELLMLTKGTANTRDLHDAALIVHRLVKVFYVKCRSLSKYTIANSTRQLPSRDSLPRHFSAMCRLASPGIIDDAQQGVLSYERALHFGLVKDRSWEDLKTRLTGLKDQEFEQFKPALVAALAELNRRRMNKACPSSRITRFRHCHCWQ